MPRLADQIGFYRKVIDAAGSKPVIFRTLDLGGDKILPYGRWEREEKHCSVGDQESADRSNEIWERTPRKGAPVHLADPAQTRGERSIGAATLWENAQPSTIEQLWSDGSFRRRLENPVEVLGEESIDLRVVLLWLERAGTVDHESAGLHDGRARFENRLLQRGHHGDI